MHLEFMSTLSQRKIGAFDTVTLKKIIVKLPRYVQRSLPKTVLCIALSKEEMIKINYVYRKKRKASNVLSFRYDQNYGEILLCLEIIRDEAEESKRTFPCQMLWMIVHGMIHLADMHHEASQENETKVSRLEKMILKKFPLCGASQ